MNLEVFQLVLGMITMIGNLLDCLNCNFSCVKMKPFWWFLLIVCPSPCISPARNLAPSQKLEVESRGYRAECPMRVDVMAKLERK